MASNALEFFARGTATAGQDERRMGCSLFMSDCYHEKKLETEEVRPALLEISTDYN